MSDDNGHDDSPSPNGANGRDAGGRFAKGNPGGPGNPNAKRVAEIREALMEAVTPVGIKVAAEKLMKQAKAGDLRAFAELLDRTVGKPVPADLEERLSALEQAVSQRNSEVRR